MQPYIFPYIGYFQLIDSVDKFILYSYVDFKKRSWINRNRILIKGQKIAYFNIPLKSSQRNKIIKDVEINTSQNWEEYILKILYFNYKRSSFYRANIKIIENILLKNNYNNLYELNNASIIEISRILDIKTEIITEREYFKDIEKDIRKNKVSKERKSERIISICNKEEEIEYINSIGGKMIYDKSYFKKHDKELKFLKSTYQIGRYTNLSIIHLLMEIGIINLKQHLKDYRYE